MERALRVGTRQDARAVELVDFSRELVGRLHVIQGGNGKLIVFPFFLAGNIAREHRVCTEINRRFVIDHGLADYRRSVNHAAGTGLDIVVHAAFRPAAAVIGEFTVLVIGVNCLDVNVVNRKFGIAFNVNRGYGV